MPTKKFSTSGNADRVSVYVNEYKGKTFVQVQREYRKYGSEEWMPGKSMTVPLAAFGEFRFAVQRCHEEYEKSKEGI